jgi:HlyD family secretion protein
MIRHSTLALTLLVGCGGFSSPVAGYTGTIEVTEVELASAIPGRITTIAFDDGDRVDAGALAFEIDREALDAERRLRSTSIDMAQATIETAEAQVRTATAQVGYLQRETDRLTRMEQAGVASAQQLSTLSGQLSVARAQAGVARQAVAQAAAGKAQAEAALASVDQRLTDAQVHATIGGVVLSRNREPGEVVSPGMSVLTLGDLDHPRLRVFVPLKTVETLSIGAPVQVFVDARPGEPYAGRVQRVASEAEFTPRDILTPEERVKRVFAVDIALDPAPGLLPGVPAEARFQ